MFEKFPSLTRFSHGWTVTEKLDGSNGAILIQPRREWSARSSDDCGPPQGCLTTVGDFAIFVQSRNKLLDLSKSGDNHGFARFVHDNAEEIVAKLGEGHHFGEWIGKGINKRSYNLDQKRFVLFNTQRWTGAELPERIDVVPILAEGYMGEPGKEFAETLQKLKEFGSVYAPNFMDPEGLVMRHGPSGTLFKKTFDYDEQGKWAENQARKETT